MNTSSKHYPHEHGSQQNFPKASDDDSSRTKTVESVMLAAFMLIFIMTQESQSKKPLLEDEWAVSNVCSLSLCNISIYRVAPNTLDQGSSLMSGAKGVLGHAAQCREQHVTLVTT